MALSFEKADKLKQDLMDSQKKEIEALYKSWSDDLAKKAKRYAASSAPSSELAEKQTKILMKQMKATGQQVSNEVYNKIKNNMYVVSNEVVKNNKSWLHSLGFKDKGLNAAFGSVPDTVVKNLVTGKIYDTGWSLSKSIWSSNEETMKSAYGIVAKGLAENSPIADIAKELSQLVNPNAAKSWNPVIAMKNTKTGEMEFKRIYKRKVDYNAQRLARTLVQHSYQQSVVAAAEKNPLITKFIWHSNGSRACELCQDRDGKEYEKDSLPMDHPNGMCFIEPVVDKDMVNKLADWFNSEDGTYPELDEFAKEFGYEAKPKVDNVRFLGIPTNPDQFKSKWGVHVSGLDDHPEQERIYMLKELDKSVEWYSENVPAFSSGERGTVKQVIFEKLGDCVGFVRSNTSQVVHCTSDYETFSKEVPNHEFTHSLIGQAMAKQGIPSYDYKAREKFCAEVKKEAFAKAELKATKGNIKKYVSDYAVTDDEEFIAEAMKGCFSKSRNKLEQSVLDVLVKKLGG